MFCLHISKEGAVDKCHLSYCPVFPALFRIFKLDNLLPACLFSPVPRMQVGEIPPQQRCSTSSPFCLDQPAASQAQFRSWQELRNQEKVGYCHSIQIMFYCVLVGCFVPSGLMTREQPQVLIQAWHSWSNVVESPVCPARHNFSDYKGH